MVQHFCDRRGDRGAVRLPIMSAAIFDLIGVDSCVSGDDMAIRKPHDESRIVGASIGIDEEPRKPRQKCGSPENTGEMACDPSRANIVGDVTVELFLRQTERAIGLWQCVCRMITKEEDARLETSLDSFDRIIRGSRWR